MKKTKQQKQPLSVSASGKKTGAFKHQMLFTPYKIQWKSIQPQTIGQASSRTFFDSMKNQLSNYKNYLQQMTKKQSNKPDNKISKPAVLEDSTNCKNQVCPKAYSSANKPQSSAEQHDTGKFQQANAKKHVFTYQSLNTDLSKSTTHPSLEQRQRCMREKLRQVQSLQKQIKIQKNLIAQLKKQNHQLYSEVQQKVKIQNLLRQVESRNFNQQQKLTQQITNLKRQLAQSQNVKNSYKLMNEDLNQKSKTSVSSQLQIEELKKTNDQLRIHNSFLEEKIQTLSEKMGLVTNKFKQRDSYTKELQSKIQQLKAQNVNNKYIGNLQQIQQYEVKLIEKQKIIEQFILEKENLLVKLQAQKKIQIQRLKQQKQRQFQIILQTQIRRVKQSCINKIKQIQNQNQSIIQQLQQQKQRLRTKIKRFEQQESFKKSMQLKQYESNKSTGSTTSNQNFSQLGSQFEKKINSLIEQNYSLKNKITNLQSEIVRIETLKNGFQYQIRLYEQIKPQIQNKESTSKQTQKLAMQMHALKKEKQQIIEQLEFRIIKLQNQLQQQKSKVANQCLQTQGAITNNIALINFNKVLKDQLQQNQDLKQKIRQLNRQLGSLQRIINQQQQKQAILSQQLAVQRMKAQLYEKKCHKETQSSSSTSQQVIMGLKYDLDLLKKKYQSINSMLESKNKLIKTKDQFIQRVLISKVGKKQQQEQMAYFIRQMKLLNGQIQN